VSAAAFGSGVFIHSLRGRGGALLFRNNCFFALLCFATIHGAFGDEETSTGKALISYRLVQEIQAGHQGERGMSPKVTSTTEALWLHAGTPFAKRGQSEDCEPAIHEVYGLLIVCDVRPECL
jgi:hypothetical protein